MVGALIYHDYVGCADEGGASFAIDALRSSAHPTALETVVINLIERYIMNSLFHANSAVHIVPANHSVLMIALRNLFLALCALCMLPSARAELSPADAQVLSVFGVLPSSYPSGVNFGPPADNRVCPISPVPTKTCGQWYQNCVVANDIYTASVGCLRVMDGGYDRFGVFLNTTLGLDSTGNVPPNVIVEPNSPLTPFGFTARCVSVNIIKDVPSISCTLWYVDVQNSTASTKNLGDDCIPCKKDMPGWAEGNPINAATGNKFQQETDFVGAASTGLELKRFYNSYNSQDSTTTAFVGAKWHGTWQRSVSLATNGPTAAYVTRADGRVDTFTQNTAGAWVSDPDVTSSLSAVMNGTTQTGWQLNKADDRTEMYTADGRLSSITDRAGKVTTLAYDANNRLITVTGPFGHTLTFAYDANNRVASVMLPDGGVVAYGYDTNNNLTSVTFPDNCYVPL